MQARSSSFEIKTKPGYLKKTQKETKINLQLLYTTNVHVQQPVPHNCQQNTFQMLWFILVVPWYCYLCCIITPRDKIMT